MRKDRNVDAIDEVFFTLYNSAALRNDLDKRAISAEALKRIKKNLASIDANTVKIEMEKYKGRLEQFETFLALPREKQESLVKKSRADRVTVEQEYTLNGSARN